MADSYMLAVAQQAGSFGLLCVRVSMFLAASVKPLLLSSGNVLKASPACPQWHSVMTTLASVAFVAGGNGKQIFGDCWWLDTEGEASVNSALSDQSIQAYLASSAGRPGGSRPLANHLHTPPSVITSSDTHRHDQSQVQAVQPAPLKHLVTHPPTHSHTSLHSLTHPSTHSLTHSLARSLARSLSLSLTHSHSLTHSLVCIS